MRSLSVGLLFSLFAVLAIPALAHDVTITGTNAFASLDGSSSDHDGAANGVFTVNDGNLFVNGVVNCNDDSGASDSACAMAFAVSGNLSVGAGGALYAENRSGSGTGGAITLTVGGNLLLGGNAIVSTASRSSSGSTGGAITANVKGAVSIASGSTIDSGSANARGGAISIAAGRVISVDGNVLSGPSRTFLATRLSGGAALDGGTSNNVGGAITLGSSTFVEPAVVIGTSANIVSQGGDGGAGPVTIDGCGIQVRGLVAALARKDGAAKVSIRSGKDLLIDGRDLGGSGTRMGRVRADAPSGTAATKGVDLFAAETIDVHGPASGLFTVTSLPGLHDSKSFGGLIRIASLGDAVNGSGNMIDDGHTAAGDSGGTVDISAKTNVTLDTAVIRAVGDFNTNNPNRGGGAIRVRSHSGSISWNNGTGEVRPVGSTSNLPLSDQGSIVLTACGAISLTGSSFPVMGTATSVFPQTTTGACSPAAPSLPAGVPPLVTCNTPPVANDASASTNEDTTVTVALSGSDADGDSLTFSVVAGPAHGTVGAVTSTGPTTATVDYKPALNYNGGDTFVARADDGNGGTDDATVTIAIQAVNDPPSFLAGPSVTVLEDSGAKSIANWVSSISAGPTDEAGQSVAFTVTNSDNALFAVQPSVSSDGTLTFTPAAHAYGSATITIVAKDDGGTANGGNDTSAPQTSTITVSGVNDEPSFAAGASQSVLEDAGAQSVSGWATAISAGPNEGGQTVSFVVSNSNNALFSVQPAVSSSGTLTYRPAANANGSATVTVYAQDNGGTADGGDDTSAPQTFTINVTAVNDAPSFTSGGNVTVLEDSGLYSAAWASQISAGPSDESAQSVTFAATNDNNALFSAQPAIDANGNLTFTVAVNASGSATVTVTASDNGGTANGGADTSAPQTFTVTIAPVNDAPSFTGGGNVTVLEDSGAYSTPWAGSISAGPGESQNVTFVVSSTNNALFAVQPAVSPAGVLTFTPAADANGSATVTVYAQDDGGTANDGDDTSSSQTFVITVTAVNDAPSFTAGGNVTVLEDSGAYSAAWATGMNAGPSDESGQSLTFNVTGNSNASLFAVAPSISSGGVLSFTIAANAFGSATLTVTLSDDGGTANGGADTSTAHSFTITVNGVNDEPSFTGGGDVLRLEDSGAYSAPWASAINPGAGESGQTVTFVVSNDHNALFAVQPSISASGVLSFTPAANAYGTATVTVHAQDNGGTANGGDDVSPAQTFVITIDPVNDAPSFTSGGNVTVIEDSGAYAAAWATAISAGPANESSQSVSFVITGNSNPSLFAVAPAVSSSGVLTFTLAANATGSANISVRAQDNGGTANGGVDVSPAVSFTITAEGINDAPTFNSGGNVTVNEDSGAYSAPWATAISAGPGESGQVVTFTASNGNNALFSVQPAISGAGVLTFTPAANAYGSATVSVFAKDNGGTANGGVDTSATVTFTITVNGVNDPPTAASDAWETEGNTELRVDRGATLTPYVGDTTPSGKGVLDNDADSVEGDPFAITGVVGCSDTTAPYVCAVTGGTVTLEANGSFTFSPNPGATSASFQYVVTDQPAAGTPASATGTVTLTIHDMIWYVNGSAPAGGNGTSSSPFNSFASLTGSGDVDAAGAYLFVHTSTVNGSIALEPMQKLWGEGVGLIIARNLNGNGSPVTLVAPGVRPTVTSIGDTVTVTGTAGVEIAGLRITSASGNGIDVSSPAFAGSASASIYSNVIASAGQEGIDVTSFNSGTTTVAINTTDIVSTGNGIDVTGGTGTVVFSYSNGTITAAAQGIHADGSSLDALYVSGLANVTISGAAAGNGIALLFARFDANPGTASFDAVNAGTVSVGTSADPVGGSAVSMSGVSGHLVFGALTAHGATNGVSIAGSGLFTGSTGMQVTIAGGAVTAAAGVGVGVSNATIGSGNLTFTSISAAGGANGISLNNTGTSGGLKVVGTGTAGSGGTITNTSGHGVSLTSTAHAAFNNLAVKNSGGSGVKGTGVTNFAFTNGSVTASGTAGGTDESNINFSGGTGSNVSGVVTITGNSLTNARYHGVNIVNGDGTISSLSISSNTLTSDANAANSLGSAIRVIMLGSASTVGNVTAASLNGNRISNFPSGAGIVVQGGNATDVAGAPAGTLGVPGNAANVIAVKNNAMSGGAGPVGSRADRFITGAVNGRGQGHFDVSDNGTAGSPITNIDGVAVELSAFGAVNVQASVSNNVLTPFNAVGSAGIAVGCDADALTTTMDGGTLSTTIFGNTVSHTDGPGVFAIARNSTCTHNARINNNVVAAPSATAAARAGIRVDSGSASGNVTMCLEITGNTTAGSTSASGSRSPGINLRKQGTNAAVNVFGIVGLSPSPTATPNVENYVNALNTSASGTFGVGGTALISATSGFTSCSIP